MRGLVTELKLTCDGCRGYLPATAFLGEYPLKKTVNASHAELGVGTMGLRVLLNLARRAGWVVWELVQDGVLTPEYAHCPDCARTAADRRSSDLAEVRLRVAERDRARRAAALADVTETRRDLDVDARAMESLAQQE